MAKQTLNERFQQLAGIKPLYEATIAEENQDNSHYIDQIKRDLEELDDKEANEYLEDLSKAILKLKMFKEGIFDTGTSSTTTGGISINSNFDSVKELMEEVLEIVRDAGPSLGYDAITVEAKIEELIGILSPEAREKDQTARRGY